MRRGREAGRHRVLLVQLPDARRRVRARQELILGTGGDANTPSGAGMWAE